MTTSPRALGAIELDASTLAIGQTVRTSQAVAFATASNTVAQGRPVGRWINGPGPCGSAAGATTYTYAVPYLWRTGARYLRVAVVLRTTFGTAATFVYGSIDLAIDDGLGNTVASSDDRIPRGFQATAVASGSETSSPLPFAGGRGTLGYTALGYLDLAQLATTLTGDEWTFTFQVKARDTADASPTLDRIELLELPSDTLDDSTVAGGALLGPFASEQPIRAGYAVPASGAVNGVQRVLENIDIARLSAPVYLGLSWVDDTAFADADPSLSGDFPNAVYACLPYTASTSPAALTNLEESAGVSVSWTVRVRRLYAASAAGEPVRWRVRYRMTAGTVETATLTLTTGATGSPYTPAAMAYSSSFVWSDWFTAELPTNGTGQRATMSIKAKVSAAPAVLWLSGIEVIGDEPA